MTPALTLLPPPAFKVDLVEKNNAHYYRVNEKDTLLPGYSTIFRKVVAKPALIKWAGDLGAREAAQAALREVKESLAAGKWSRPLDQAAIAWEEEGANAPNARRDKAAGTGTLIHSDLEAFMGTGKLPDRVRTSEDAKAIANFLSFWGDSGLRLVAAEVCVAVPPEEMIPFPFGGGNGREAVPAGWPSHWPCSPYGGRLDMIVADKSNRLYIADVKTGNVVDRMSGRPFPDMFVQMGAYSIAAKCTYPGLKIHGLIGFHVRHDISPERVRLDCHDMATAEKAWLRVRGLYDDLKVLHEGAA